MARVGVMLVVVVGAGCGGGGAASETPMLPHALGAQLAGQASAVEASLARDDSCTAAGQATRLRDMVAAAISSGQVPAALRPPLSSSAGSLADEIVCTPPPSPPGQSGGPGKDEKPPGKHDRHGHDKDGGED